tara:strand:+ start:1863 stop:2213 length:351 start_codon:yes stop_codon:yes gene_type:complete
MNIIELLKGFSFFILAHISTTFQLNGQFKWDWFKENEWVLALFGVPISLLYIWGTKYTVNGFEGLLWPSRFIGFGVGIVVYGLIVGWFFNEGMNMKTIVSLILSIILICIQVFWKK